MKSWSPLQSCIEPPRAPLELRSSDFTFIKNLTCCQNLIFCQKLWFCAKMFKRVYFDLPLISDLFHVSECEIDHGDGALLACNIHCHHRGIHGSLGWILCLYDLWGSLTLGSHLFSYEIMSICKLTEMTRHQEILKGTGILQLHFLAFTSGDWVVDWPWGKVDLSSQDVTVCPPPFFSLS